MTADQLKTLTTDALDTLATLLDEGHSEQLTALLKTMGRFHRYSFHNLCLIIAQSPSRPVAPVSLTLANKRSP